jgi:hypothetical protein
MLNDRLLGSYGIAIAPLAVAAATQIIPRIFGGPTQEFQQRQALRDQIDSKIAEVQGALPSFPESVQSFVKADVEEFWKRTHRENLRKDDYLAAIAWFNGRVQVWQQKIQEAQAAEAAVAPSPGTGARIISSTGLETAGFPTWLAVGLLAAFVVPMLFKR